MKFKEKVMDINTLKDKIQILMKWEINGFKPHNLNSATNVAKTKGLK